MRLKDVPPSSWIISLTKAIASLLGLRQSPDEIVFPWLILNSVMPRKNCIKTLLLSTAFISTFFSKIAFAVSKNCVSKNEEILPSAKSPFNASLILIESFNIETKTERIFSSFPVIQISSS